MNAISGQLKPRKGQKWKSVCQPVMRMRKRQQDRGACISVASSNCLETSAGSAFTGRWRWVTTLSAIIQVGDVTGGGWFKCTGGQRHGDKLKR